MNTKEKISHIIDNFDFGPVCEHMKKTDWKWYTQDGELKTPTFEQLVTVAQSLLAQAARNIETDPARPIARVCSGGFAAIAWREDGETWLRLSFEIAHS
ncbi:MAG: hypothetical protein LIO90_02205 [Bacteroidales bacterium]|nr:hypothetical protein [Bacteroidales bacterium]